MIKGVALVGAGFTVGTLLTIHGIAMSSRQGHMAIYLTKKGRFLSAPPVTVLADMVPVLKTTFEAELARREQDESNILGEREAARTEQISDLNT